MAGKIQTTYNPQQRYKVVKLFKISHRRQILERGLTRAEAMRVTNSFPDSSKHMILFEKQAPFLDEIPVPEEWK